MKHKTELRKGLVRVAISGAAPVGTEITGREQAGGDRCSPKAAVRPLPTCASTGPTRRFRQERRRLTAGMICPWPKAVTLRHEIVNKA